MEAEELEDKEIADIRLDCCLPRATGFRKMAEEKELELDQTILSLELQELKEFASFIKIDEKITDGQSKVKIIKEIRKKIDSNLETVDAEGIPSYLDSLIKTIKDQKIEKNSEVEKLEQELKEIEIKRKEIEQKLSKTSTKHTCTESTPKTGNATFADLTSQLSASMFYREFKIQGTIGEPGQKDKLTYQSLISQIETGLKRNYSNKEVVLAVIRAVQPGLQLRSYLESVSDLTLERLRKILRFHFHEKSATELYQLLTTATQQQNEDPQSFLMRALTIRQKIVFASKEADSGITYDSSSVQSLFLHALETGLKEETIRAKIRPALAKKNVTDEELIEAMFLAVSAETERSNKFNLPSTKQKSARVAAVGSDSGTEAGKEVLSAINALKAEFSAIQTEVKALRESSNQRTKTNTSNPPTNTSNQPTFPCNRCKTPRECNHCYACGGSNHFARDCRSRSSSGNGRGLQPRDRQ